MWVARKGRRLVHLLGVSTTERRQSEQLGWAARASSFDNRDTWSLNRRFCSISSGSSRIRVMKFNRRTHHTTVGAPIEFHRHITNIVGGDIKKGMIILLHFLG